jgi:hypothetical protein
MVQELLAKLDFLIIQIMAEGKPSAHKIFEVVNVNATFKE